MSESPSTTIGKINLEDTPPSPIEESLSPLKRRRSNPLNPTLVDDGLRGAICDEIEHTMERRVLPQLFEHLDSRFQVIQQQQRDTNVSATEALNQISTAFGKLQVTQEAQEIRANIAQENTNLIASSLSQMRAGQSASDVEIRRLLPRQQIQESDVGW